MRCFGNHVQANGRFIEQKQLRAVKKRGRHFAAHALPQGELAHGRLQQIPDLKCFRELTDAFLRLAIIQFVNFSKEREGVDGGQVIPQLRALAEDRANVIGQFAALLPGCVAKHLGLAIAGKQDAGQHFDGGGLAGPVRADEAEQFARFHLEREPAYRFDGDILRPDERAQTAAQPGGFAFGLEGFLQVSDLDSWHWGILLLLA